VFGTKKKINQVEEMDAPLIHIQRVQGSDKDMLFSPPKEKLMVVVIIMIAI